jgi:acylphosphatase
MSEKISEVHCIVTGRVQGVAYRNFAHTMANELGLTGFVSNLPDGTVEVLAQGGYGVLKVYESHLRTGPADARVKNIYQDWREPSKEYDGFKIL